MVEVLVIALLIWLWNIERRLNTIRDAVNALKLDVDGLRALRLPRNNVKAPPPSNPAPLPEVTSLNGSNKAAAG